jgi:fructose-1-phosphate kinase PfkB-like protein
MQVLNLLVGIAFHSYVCVKALRQVDKLIMSKQSIRRKNLVVGLNPALQRVIDFNKLEVGSVNRGSNVQVGIGGKGQNAYISSLCTSLSQPSSLLQFVGSGGEGDTLIKLLHQLGSNISDINDFSIRTVSSCRTCITLIDKSTEEVTELIEPSGAIEPSEIEEMFSKLSSSFDHRNKVGGIAVMGSSPPGCPSSLYSDIIRLVCDNQSKVR